MESSADFMTWDSGHCVRSARAAVYRVPLDGEAHRDSCTLASSAWIFGVRSASVPLRPRTQLFEAWPRGSGLDDLASLGFDLQHAAPRQPGSAADDRSNAALVHEIGRPCSRADKDAPLAEVIVDCLQRAPSQLEQGKYFMQWPHALHGMSGRNRPR